MVEPNMCNAVMRGIVVPPGSRATSRAQGSRRNLGISLDGGGADHIHSLRRSAGRLVVAVTDH
jgi:hypothetical protein